MSKKKLIFVFVIIPLFSLLAIASFTKFFGTKSATVHVTKKSYFQFDLVVSLDNIELGPGESVSIKPKVVSDSTEDMYVFIKVLNPTFNGEPLYIYDVDDKDDVFVTSICINNLTEDNIYGNNLLIFAYIFKLDTKNMIGYAKEIFTNDIVSILEKVIKK